MGGQADTNSSRLAPWLAVAASSGVALRACGGEQRRVRLPDRGWRRGTRRRGSGGRRRARARAGHAHISHYLLIVRSLANPSSLSTHRSGLSLFSEREDLGETFCASATVTIFSNSSIGPASAVHSNLALFSNIT